MAARAREEDQVSGACNGERSPRRVRQLAASDEKGPHKHIAHNCFTYLNGFEHALVLLVCRKGTLIAAHYK